MRNAQARKRSLPTLVAFRIGARELQHAGQSPLKSRAWDHIWANKEIVRHPFGVHKDRPVEGHPVGDALRLLSTALHLRGLGWREAHPSAFPSLDVNVSLDHLAEARALECADGGDKTRRAREQGYGLRNINARFGEEHTFARKLSLHPERRDQLRDLQRAGFNRA